MRACKSPAEQKILRAAQDANRERGNRLAAKLSLEADKIQNAAGVPGPDGAPPDEEALAAQSQRIEVAGQLLAGALEAMDAVNTELGGDGSFQTAIEGRTRLKELLADKSALLILDDVWRRSDAWLRGSHTNLEPRSTSFQET